MDMHCEYTSNKDSAREDQLCANVGVDFRNHLSRSIKLRTPRQRECIFLLYEGDVRMGCWDGMLG